MKISKLQVFILTFLCYVSIHSLRTSYSFSKTYLKDQIFGEDDPDAKTKISIVDSILLLMLGLGHFLHTIRPIKKPVRSLWVGTLICGLEYLLIPFLIVTLDIKSYPLLIILIGLNGFLQSYSWPQLLVIINHYFDKDKNSGILGFWSANANVGNILGFMTCNILIQRSGLDWQIGMYAAGCFVIIVILIVAVRIPEVQDGYMHSIALEKQNDINQSQDKLDEKLIKNGEPYKEEQIQDQKISFVKIFKQPKVILVSIIFSLMKSVVYGVMLWLPLYFTQIGYGEYKTYIPSSYDIAAIFGSLMLGYLFRKTKFKGLLLSPVMALLVIEFSILRFVELKQIVFYFIIIAAVGFCLGGSFNTTASLVTIELANIVPKKLQAKYLGFFAALIMAIGNTITALTQIVIGFVQDATKTEGKASQSSIFMIFMGYSGVAFLSCLLLVFREIIISKKAAKQQNQNIQEQAASQTYQKKQKKSKKAIKNNRDRNSQSVSSSLSISIIV